MPRVKKPEPLSLSLSPLHKKEKNESSDKERKKIGIINKAKNRKMLSVRMRTDIIDLLDDLIKRLKKKTRNRYSQSAVIEMALMYASHQRIEDLLDSYGDSFKI